MLQSGGGRQPRSPENPGEHSRRGVSVETPADATPDTRPRCGSGSGAIGAKARYPGHGGVSPRPGVIIEPGPWITKNQTANASAQANAVVAKILAITPLRWS